MLRIPVKASAVTNLTDARYFAAWEVKWLGFCLDPASGHYIQPQQAAAIREWIDGPLIAGEFNLQSADEIRTAIDWLKLDAVQVGMLTEVETLIDLQSPVPVIKEIVVERDAREDAIGEYLRHFAPYAGIFLLNFTKNGISWQAIKAGAAPVSLPALREWCRTLPVLLSIDLHPGIIDDLLQHLPVLGLSIQGGEEEKTGFKSFDELDAILEALEG